LTGAEMASRLPVIQSRGDRALVAGQLRADAVVDRFTDRVDESRVTQPETARDRRGRRRDLAEA
jgi:hypothetical protein